MYALTHCTAPYAIISKHHTVKAAYEASAKLHRANGPTHYIPTVIMTCPLKATHKKHCSPLSDNDLGQLLYDTL